MYVPRALALFVVIASACAAQTSGPKYTHSDGQQFLKKHCVSCHNGKLSAGGFDISGLAPASSLRDKPEAWSKIALRVHNGEMPPKSAVPLDDRETFVVWVRESLRTEACAAGLVPGPAPARRLSRAQYTATIRDLLNLHMDAGSVLPADGAGGEGFDNAAETLFLSPIHAEKYLEAAKLALNYASKDPRARAKFLIASPGKELTPPAAARVILQDFLPRAFRRPPEAADLDFYLGLFETAHKRGESFDDAILYAL